MPASSPCRPRSASDERVHASPGAGCTATPGMRGTAGPRFAPAPAPGQLRAPTLPLSITPNGCVCPTFWTSPGCEGEDAVETTASAVAGKDWLGSEPTARGKGAARAPPAQSPPRTVRVARARCPHAPQISVLPTIRKQRGPVLPPCSFAAPLVSSFGSRQLTAFGFARFKRQHPTNQPHARSRCSCRRPSSRPPSWPRLRLPRRTATRPPGRTTRSGRCSRARWIPGLISWSR